MIDRAAFELRRRECASKYGVSPEIHDRDFIFQHLVDAHSSGSPIAAIDEYFTEGRWFADQLDELVGKFLHPAASPIDVLEFAPGYGRVSRHLQTMSGKFRIWACDIHPEAVVFLENRLGVQAILSHKVPERLAINRQFDVVFALSFFTHMPDVTWGRWLSQLFALVSEGGLLIFTTHGRNIAKICGSPPLGDEGYWFSHQSEQADLATEEYGTTISLFPYVFGKLRRLDGAQLVFFQERHWGDYQDTYVVQKTGVEKPPDATGFRSATPARRFNRELIAKGMESLRVEGFRSTALRVWRWMQRH